MYRSLRNATALPLIGLLAATAPAFAGPHPGEMWRVDLVRFVTESGAPDATALAGPLGSGLREANETYFYGDQPVVMTAVRRGDRIDVTITDRLTGAPLARVRGLPGSDGPALQEAVLAWMDGLSCAAAACAQPETAIARAEPPAGPAPAALGAGMPQVAERVARRAPGPVAAPMADSADAAEPLVRYPETLAHAVAPVEPAARADGIPVPRARPGAALARGVLARNPDLDAVRYQIARFARLADGLADGLTYGPGDRVVIDGGPVLQDRIGRLPPEPAQGGTVLDRLVSDFVRIFNPRAGFGSAPEPRPAPRVAAVGALSATDALIDEPAPPSRQSVGTPRPAPAPSLAERPPATGGDATATAQPAPRPSAALASRAAERRAAPQPFRPTARWRLAPSSGRSALLTEPEPVAGDAGGAPAPRIVSIDPGYRATLFDAAPGEARALSIVPGLGAAPPPPAARTEADAPSRPATLRVRLDPSVFGGQPQSLLRRLLSPPESQRPSTGAAVQTASVEEDPNSDAVIAALARKGLELDTAAYSTRMRVFWGGHQGSRGFWVSLPRYVDSGLVLVATEKASVVADVRNRPGPIRLSDAVAAALGLEPHEWSEVRVIALRQRDGAGPDVAAIE